MFPKCELQGCNIVHEFPSGCPFSYDDIDGRQLQIRDKSFWDGKSDPHEPVMLAEIDTVCNDCIRRLIGNPQVKYLRAKGPLH